MAEPGQSNEQDYKIIPAAADDINQRPLSNLPEEPDTLDRSAADDINQKPLSSLPENPTT